MYTRELGSIPEETVRIAHAACPKGTVAMRLRDELGEVYQDEHFASLYPVEGQPAYAPWRLALVTVLQYTEGLTDRQAANAVRERIDWKYSLGLDLTDTGFDFSVLSEFRKRLVDEGAETLLLDRLLEVCKQRGWLKAGGKQRTDSTHVLARVRSLSNLECVGETLRAVLDDLAALVPEWLVQQISPDWFERVPPSSGELSLAQSGKPTDRLGPADRCGWTPSVTGTGVAPGTFGSQGRGKYSTPAPGLAAVLRPVRWKGQMASRPTSQ